MKDMLYRGVALNKAVRVIGINSKNIVSQMALKHQTTPCASAALGRTISIVALMGNMLKNNDSIIVNIDGDGPLGQIHTKFYDGNKIKGYVDNPQVEIKINDANKLDVKGVVGTNGTLSVILKQGLKNDYHGSIPLVSGEISEDFTYYFAVSEQTPSIVSAGVLVDKDMNVTSSGAIIIQLLPEACEEDIEYLENSLSKVSDISKTLLDNPNILDLFNDIFDDFELLEQEEILYECDCSYEDMQSKIATLSLEDLNEIKIEDKGLEAVCPWCNTEYFFDEDAIDKIIDIKNK
ncbi:MAG: Hsp33 family molecular chaperone HslO [Erysipelotrichales bacterium]